MSSCPILVPIFMACGFGLVSTSPAEAQNERANAKTDLVRALRDALPNEKDNYVRVHEAWALLKLDGNDKDAAKIIVEGYWQEGVDISAQNAMEELITNCPPALLSAIIPFLKDKDDTKRRRAAALLARIDPNQAFKP